MQIELKRLQHETGITFIFVTHDQEEALTMSDRIAVMSKGKILQIGSPRDIYDRPAERFVANFIGETNFLDGEVVGEQGGGQRQVKLQSGGTVDARAARGRRQRARSRSWCGPSTRDRVPPASRPTLAGTLENVVYFGTDTHYHVMLDGGDDVHRPPPEPAAPAPRLSRRAKPSGISFDRRCRPGAEGLTHGERARDTAAEAMRAQATSRARAGCCCRRRCIVLFLAAHRPAAHRAGLFVPR